MRETATISGDDQNPTVMTIAQTLSKSRKYEKGTRYEEPHKSSHDTLPPIGVNAPLGKLA